MVRPGTRNAVWRARLEQRRRGRSSASLSEDLPVGPVADPGAGDLLRDAPCRLASGPTARLNLRVRAVAGEHAGLAAAEAHRVGLRRRGRPRRRAGRTAR